MKLWLISQNVNTGYDTYDSAVVAAENEEDARSIRPDSWGWVDECGYWVKEKQQVRVKYLGEARELIERGVICASFNAG